MNNTYKVQDVMQNKDKGITVVVIEFNNKLYTGVAKIHPDDLDCPSDFFAFEIAVLRAELNFLYELFAETKESPQGASKRSYFKKAIKRTKQEIRDKVAARDMVVDKLRKRAETK